LAVSSWDLLRRRAVHSVCVDVSVAAIQNKNESVNESRVATLLIDILPSTILTEDGALLPVKGSTSDATNPLMPSRHCALIVIVFAMFRGQSFLAFAFRLPLSIARKQQLSTITSTSHHIAGFQDLNNISSRKSLLRANHNDVATNSPDDAVVKEETLNWLRRVVIGLNLCPFAERPLRQDAVHIDIVRGNDDEEILSKVFDQLLVRTTQPGTTLVVCPECYPTEFESYLDVLELIETGIIKDDATFEGVVQVAPFHPLFQFEGSEPDSIDNWTNRSPYPLFHILREDEVSAAVDRLDGDAGKVWKRNADLIQALEQALDSEGFQEVMRGEPSASKQTRIRDILKSHRIDMSSKIE
jgi:hypothetical protein